MAFGFGAALAAAAGPLLDTASNVGLSIYGMNRQAHENRMNYNRQVDMWNMTNAYNTPEQQMKRFKEAGLNPNLIYGQTNTAQMPNADAGYINPNFNKISMFSDALDGYQNRKDAEATLKRMEEQKAYDRKRQEIIDNRQAKAFEMEMKLKQAQIDNIKAKPYIEAQKNQVAIEKQEIKDSDKKLKGLIGYKNVLNMVSTASNIYNRNLGVIPTKFGLGKYAIRLGPVYGPIAAGLQLGYSWKKFADYITDKKVLDSISDGARKYAPWLKDKYEENIWR